MSLFGRDHLIVLGLTIAVSIALARLSRGRPDRAARIQRVLAIFLPLMCVTWPLEELTRGNHGLSAILPLDLCTFNLLVAIAAIATSRQIFFECMFFWSAGAFLAMVTPPIREGFPAPRFLSFFALHGLLVASWSFLVYARGMRPRPRAWLRVWGITNVYVVVVALIDWLLDQNYMFLMHKPVGGKTLLDAFGHYPIYIFTADAFMLPLFFVMQLAVTRRRAPAELPPETELAAEA